MTWRRVAGIAVAVGACGGVAQPLDGAAGDDAADDAARIDARLADANLGDRYVFVTSSAFAGDLGGLAGADLRCQNAAGAVGLPGAYMAWLSDDTGSPSTRMNRGPGRFRTTNGVVVAVSWVDLTDGALLTRIDRDERGDLATGTFVCQGGEVWTNTTVAGTVRAATDCDNWSTRNTTSNAGNVGFADGNWTESGCVSITCASALPLYCFQQ